MQDNLTSEMWGAADLLELRSTADTHYCYIPMLRPMGYSMLQHMVCCTDACCGSGHAAWRSLLAGEASVCWVAGRHSECCDVWWQGGGTADVLSRLRQIYGTCLPSGRARTALLLGQEHLRSWHLTKVNSLNHMGRDCPPSDCPSRTQCLSRV